MSDENTTELFPQPNRNDGVTPCGECHLQPSETCDICGAIAPGACYTRWGQPFNVALARGHDHGSAAHIADQWEAKHMHLTMGAGIIQSRSK